MLGLWSLKKIGYDGSEPVSYAGSSFISSRRAGGTGGNAGSYSLLKQGAGTTTLSAANTHSGGMTINGGLINFSAGNLGTGTITLNSGGLQSATGNTFDISSRLAALGAGGGTFDTNGNNITLASAIGDMG